MYICVYVSALVAFLCHLNLYIYILDVDELTNVYIYKHFTCV